jgi:fumarate hydratase class I
MPVFAYQDMLPLGEDQTPYKLLTRDYVRALDVGGRSFVEVDREGLALLTREAMRDIAHLLRPGHLAQLAGILNDPEASPNDRFVALDLLKNANISAGGVLPMCQDTGTAIIMGKKGQGVLTHSADPTLDCDEAALSRGVFDTYQTSNLRYSQLAPLTLFDEKNTGNNLPAQIELYATPGDAYKFLFMAKGGGSANKSYLYQETKALLNPKSLVEFLDRNLRTLGTSACPPYHLAVVIGGTSAEQCLKVGALSRHPADRGERARARLSRLGVGEQDPHAHEDARHRRAVRRQVLLPRRARDSAASAWRVVPRRHRGVVLC